MTRTLFAAVLVMFASIAFFFVAGGVELIRVGNGVHNDVHNLTAQAATQLTTVTNVATTQVTSVGTAVTNQIGKIDKTQQTLDEVLYNSKRLIQHADIASVKEAAYLDSWNGQLTQTFTGINDGVKALNANQDWVADKAVAVLDTTQTTIADLQPVLKSANSTITSVQPLLGAITYSVEEMQPAITSGVHMVDTADKVETKATAGYLKPPSKNPFVRTGKAIGPFVLPVLRIGAALSDY